MRRFYSDEANQGYADYGKCGHSRHDGGYDYGQGWQEREREVRREEDDRREQQRQEEAAEERQAERAMQARQEQYRLEEQRQEDEEYERRMINQQYESQPEPPIQPTP